MLASVLASSSVDVSARDGVGGGFADRGVRGKWYANAEFKGEPAFERRDVRIDFDSTRFENCKRDVPR